MWGWSIPCGPLCGRLGSVKDCGLFGWILGFRVLISSLESCTVESSVALLFAEFALERWEVSSAATKREWCCVWRASEKRGRVRFEVLSCNRGSFFVSRWSRGCLILGDFFPTFQPGLRFLSRGSFSGSFQQQAGLGRAGSQPARPTLAGIDYSWGDRGERPRSGSGATKHQIAASAIRIWNCRTLSRSAIPARELQQRFATHTALRREALLES